MNVFFILAAVFLAGGWMDTPDRTSDRLAVDMGVMPAEAIRSQYGADSAEANAFGGVPGADDSYLVTFAVRERESDRRVEDASVTATVGQLGLSGTSKELRPATFGGIRTFGNYFHMPRAGLYEIELRIERPGVAGTDLVRLQYHRS